MRDRPHPDRPLRGGATFPSEWGREGGASFPSEWGREAGR